MKTYSLVRLVLLVQLSCLMALTAACGAAPKKTSTEVRIAATADVNPDLEDRPSPIILHILELTAIDEFNRADFFSLTQQDAAALGGDVMNKTEVILTPGSQTTATLDLDASVAYLGFVAGYRDIDSSRWRISQAVRPGQTNWVSVNLDRSQVSIIEVND